jgi:hypothetical protein
MRSTSRGCFATESSSEIGLATVREWSGGLNSVELEHLAEPPLLVLGRIPPFAATRAISIAISIAIVVIPVVVCAPEEFVQLAAVEPHASTLRAVVDLDALAFGYQQRGGINGTLHGIDLLV